MKKILIIGMNPFTLDFSLPGFPPGMTAEKVEAGISADLEKLKTMGYDPKKFWIDNGDTDQNKLIGELNATKFDGVVIGAGIRIPPHNFNLLEKIVNTVHENAANSKIIFNTNPTDTFDSIKRWV
jgi:hypothetical protein